MRKTHLSHVAGLCLIASGAMAETPVLTVYTYDSFTSDWGPGPVIEKAFEEVCGCDLNLVGLGDGAALLARLEMSWQVPSGMSGKRAETDSAQSTREFWTS